MRNYKIIPKWKRSVFEYTTYENEEKTISFETEHQYRWGTCLIRVNDNEKIEDIIGDPNDEHNEFEIDSNNKSLIETHQDDLIYSCFQNAKGITEEDLEKKEEEDYKYISENFKIVDSYHKYTSTLLVEDVTDTHGLPSSNDYKVNNIYKAIVSEIINDEYGSIALKEPIEFDLVYKPNGNGTKNLFFSVGASEKDHVAVTLSTGETALFYDSYGSETIKDAAIRIGTTLGGMYSIMAKSSLEKETPDEDNIRAHLLKIKSDDNNYSYSGGTLDQTVADLVKSGNRRKIIYLWYAENCVNFPKK